MLVVATAHAAVSPLPMIWNDTFIGRDRPGQVAADQRICRAQRRAYASLFRKASIPDKTIHIVALGGSMVVGIDTRCGKACAYPAYFARWLAARSAASVELENRAAGGMTSATALPVLGSLVRPLHGQNSPDLVLVDFGMNNAWSELTAADVFGATEAQLRVLLRSFLKLRSQSSRLTAVARRRRASTMPKRPRSHARASTMAFRTFHIDACSGPALMASRPGVGPS